MKVQCIGATNNKTCLDCPHNKPHDKIEEYGSTCGAWSRCDYAHNGRHSKVRCVKSK